MRMGTGQGADIISLSLGFDRARDAAPSVLSRSLSRLSRKHRVRSSPPPAMATGSDGIKNPAAGAQVLAIGALDLAGRVPVTRWGRRRSRVSAWLPDPMWCPRRK